MRIKLFWYLYAYFYDSISKTLPYRELMDKVSDCFDFEPNSNSVLLDLGCGTGNYLLRLAGRNVSWRFYGVDASPPMLYRAKNKLKKMNKLLIRGNIEKGIPLADSSVDGIALVNVLYTAEEPRNVIKECHNVLKFDGILVVANPHPGAKITAIVKFKDIVLNPSFWIVACINVVIKMLSRKKFNFMDKVVLEEMLDDIGFQIMRSELAYGDTDVFIVARKVLVFEVCQDKIKAGIAHSPKDLKDMHRLRFEVYCNELKSLSASDYPNGEEADEYDAYSVPIILKLGSEMIGTMRMVKDSCLGFVLDNCFKLPAGLDRSKTLEYSRAIIKIPYRKGRNYKFLLLAAKQWQIEHGYTACISAANVGVASKILEGERWQHIGEPKLYHNIISAPMMRCLNN